MSKRILAALCALIMLLTLFACENKNDGGDEEKKEEATAAVEEITAEDVFGKAFEADKTYDIQGMAQVEYSINFGKSMDKDALVKKTEDSLKAIDEDTLKEYKERIAEVTYTIIDKTPLEGQELKNRISQLEPLYNDTDKITEIVKLIYQVNDPDSDDPEENAVEMIRVGDTWYCYMGENTWGS